MNKKRYEMSLYHAHEGGAEEEDKRRINDNKIKIKLNDAKETLDA